jgi:signal transduction histidine kinase
MDQMITEYHILRQVICDVMEKDTPLTSLEREIIVCSVEQAVNDAATQFSDTLRDLQQKLSNTLAHDLRNPLTTARLGTELILKRPEDEKGTLEKANRISVSLIRIDKMITELLDASRLNAGEALPDGFQECDLVTLVGEVAHELNMNYDNRLVVETHGDCKGSWNEDGLRRLTENLLTNAIKYGKEKTPVTISLEEEDDMVVLSVHNEGDPIPQEEQSGLFDNFKRAKSAENQIGWGLGLSVVKAVADSHKGSFTIESEKGTGTFFRVKIPKNPFSKPGINNGFKGFKNNEINLN